MRRFMMLLFKLVPDGQSWRTVQYIWIHFPRIDHFNGDANMPSKVYFTSKNYCQLWEISSMQKKEAEDLSCFSWKEFALLGSLDREFP
ncbi:hypothetical protein ACSBR2_013026 [Camellia fascicularis]